MENTKGVIYILTNPSFKEYVKIGYADNIEQRLQQLNRSECIPFAFRVYATYEVPSRLSDLKIHSIIDKLNPELRSIDNFNGQKRVREFYAMTPEDAYSIFEAIAEIHDCKDKLKLWEANEVQLQAEEIAEEIATETRKRADNWTIAEWGIPVGAVLEYADDPTITCTVIDDRKIMYEGEITYMTPLIKKLTGKSWMTNGPHHFSRHFKYNGVLLKDLEKHPEP